MIKCFVKFLKLFLITTILLLTLSCNSLVGEGTSKESDIDLDKDSTQVTENITKSNNEESIKNLNSNKDSSTDNDSQIKSNSKDK